MSLLSLIGFFRCRVLHFFTSAFPNDLFRFSKSKVDRAEYNKNLHFQLNEFVNKFENEGPGVVEDMDKGQKLMEVYASEFEKLETTRLEMGN